MKSADSYRSLTSKEILLLEANGCRADSWSNVRVVQNFNPLRLTHVRFHNKVYLGEFTGSVDVSSTGKVESGIHHAILDSVTVGDNVYIYKIGTRISGYHIGDHAVIDHVGELITEPEHTFGNGTMVKVINENGGRSVCIYDTMNSHVGFLQAAFRHRPKLIETLQAVALRRAEASSRQPGVIGEHASIRHTKIVRNVVIGPHSCIDGASALINGTILSNRDMPVRIGINVYAKNFVIQEGTSVSYGSSLENSFIGQSVKVEKQFSSIDSAAFAGSEFGHGEIASVFAGPFSVSHHKGTLLIACSLSFFNAGSGTNQSNHMYKLGPNSQGIMDRGCKTASNVYLRWPKRIGAGTVIMGEHVTPCDLRQFPFSYLVEIHQRSVLLPGRNIGTIGILRDIDKWKKRDARRGRVIRDRLNFSLINPMTMQALVEGIETLQKLHADAVHQDAFDFDTYLIRRKDLDDGLELYEMLLRSYLGSVLLTPLEHLLRASPECSLQEVLAALESQRGSGQDVWTDLGGMILPLARVNSLIEGIEEGAYPEPEDIDGALDQCAEAFQSDELDWCLACIESKKYRKLQDFSAADFLSIVRHWIDAERGLCARRMEDARKEFCDSAMTGYGAVPGTEAQIGDFSAVNKSLDENPAIRAMKDALQRDEATAEYMEGRFSAL